MSASPSGLLPVTWMTKQTESSMTRTKIKAKSKTKADNDGAFHPYSISIGLKTQRELDELIRWCKDHGLFYTVHDYDE